MFIFCFLSVAMFKSDVEKFFFTHFIKQFFSNFTRDFVIDDSNAIFKYTLLHQSITPGPKFFLFF